MIERQKRAYGQGGFTLIEIIAVLIILGILAIVAIPKYFDMQDAARKRAAAGLVAAAQSQLSFGFSNSLLNTAWTFSPVNECANVALTNLGEDVSLTCTGGAGDASIGITANVGGQEVNSTWNNPSSKAATTTGS